MKIKGLLFLLTVFSVLLGGSLLLKEDTPLRIITSPSIYSYLNSSEIESFRLKVLMNKTDSYYSNMEYISSISLKDEETEIPLMINQIYETENRIKQEEEVYYEVIFDVKLKVSSNDLMIALKKAYLDVVYDNGFSVSLYMGEFQYGYVELSNDDFYLENLKATYTEINGINSVSGVYIELYNNTDHNIVIHHFDVLSELVHFNNYYVTRVGDVEMFETVEEILNIPYYEFYGTDVSNINEVIYKGQSVSYYIPLVFEDIGFIQRFPIAISYEIDGVDKVYYMDDFIFMSNSIFNQEYEDGFIVYEYSD